MALDVFQFFIDNPKYNKLVGNDFMFVEYKCPLEVEQFKLWTDNNFLTYVISGKKDWTSLNEFKTIEQGDVLFLKKGVYNTKQYFDVDYCVLLFFITDDFIRNFIKQQVGYKKTNLTYPADKQIFSVDPDPSLKSLFLTIFNYLQKGEEIPRELVEMKFKELLYTIILNPANNELVNHFHSLQNSFKSSLNEIMLQNFHCDLSLNEYARLSGRSLSSFKRDFKQSFNETPHKWIVNKRLNYAKSLLQNPELNINDICFEAGFKNTSHFNNSFKEKFQLPPNQFRKAHYNL
ncbi:AraC family transcriptional regulator [Urechidicola vernalis]|uniref:AraC family transcriptional regulator n=1 Tax=Urechidicola vernalis TaxID=3075600 RepID=A0ABU2Y491_9FLAO|nr:AraC family transcriptional regulator [Urechidicola sp. P050]MDT0553009.1 AraC family transcriptional regulator [Urechidicola sp. P050]